MSEPQGPDISTWQSQQKHREAGNDKGGFGLGHSDSIATITDGMKWMFNFHEGALAAYNNVFDGLVSGSSLVTLFGKSGNMLGIKFLEELSEFFSGGEEGGGMSQDGMDDAHHGMQNPDDYPHASDEVSQNADGLRGSQHSDDSDHGPMPSHSPSIGGDDHSYEVGH